MDTVDVPSPQGMLRLISQIWNLVKTLRQRGSDEKKKGSYGVRGKKKKREETKKKTTAASRVLNTKKRTELSEYASVPLTFVLHVCVTERNKGWRKMENIRVFSSSHFSALVNRTPKSLWVFLPPGPWKHLTLLTSLPERAWVQERQRDSTMRENWREKDKSGRKREHFYASETLTFREDVSMVPNGYCAVTDFVQQNLPVCVSLYCRLHDDNFSFISSHLLHLNLTLVNFCFCWCWW